MKKKYQNLLKTLKDDIIYHKSIIEHLSLDEQTHETNLAKNYNRGYIAGVKKAVELIKNIADNDK